MPGNNKTVKSGQSQGGGVYPGTALWDPLWDPKFKEMYPGIGTSVPSPSGF